MAMGTISRVVYIGTNLTNFIIFYPVSLSKMDVWLEFDFQGQWGVDGMNLLISMKLTHLWGLFPHYITLYSFTTISIVQCTYCNAHIPHKRFTMQGVLLADCPFKLRKVGCWVKIL